MCNWNYLIFVSKLSKQKRSTEGYSKFKVRNHDKFRRELLQHKNKCKSQIGQDQVSGRVSVLSRLSAPYANILQKPPRLYNKAQFVNNVTKCNVRSIEGVSVYGLVPENIM